MKSLSFKWLLGLAAVVAVNPDTASAADDVELEPSSSWIVNYDDDSCALSRQFGGDDYPFSFEIRAFDQTDRLEMIVASPAFNRRRRAPATAFEPDTDTRRNTDALLINFENDYEGFVFSYSFMSQAMLQEWRDYSGEGEEPPAFTPEVRNAREAEVRTFRIERSFSKPIVLRTGEMHQPMEALRTCLDELLTHWGIDVEAHKALSRPLAPLEMQQWARVIQESYPSRMASRNLPGRLRIRLNVSEEGRPTACGVMNNFNDEVFEEAACNLLMHNAQFEPALDADGEAIASFYILAIFYQIGPPLR